MHSLGSHLTSVESGKVSSELTMSRILASVSDAPQAFVHRVFEALGIPKLMSDILELRSLIGRGWGYRRAFDDLDFDCKIDYCEAEDDDDLLAIGDLWSAKTSKKIPSVCLSVRTLGRLQNFFRYTITFEGVSASKQNSVGIVYL